MMPLTHIIAHPFPTIGMFCLCLVVFQFHQGLLINVPPTANYGMEMGMPLRAVSRKTETRLSAVFPGLSSRPALQASVLVSAFASSLVQPSWAWAWAWAWLWLLFSLRQPLP